MLRQVLANSIITASSVGLCGVGFSIIYRTGCFHFAHGVVVTSAAYFAYTLTSVLGTPPFVALPLALILSGVLGCGMDSCVYRQLRRRGASALVLMLASLGMYVALQNTISMTFGDETRTVGSIEVREGIEAFGVRVTRIQLGTICAAVVLIGTTVMLLSRTRLGKSIRALASNEELAGASGIDCDKARVLAFALGSGLAWIFQA